MKREITLKYRDGYWKGDINRHRSFLACHGGLSDWFDIKKSKKYKIVVSDKKLPDSYEFEKEGAFGHLKCLNINQRDGIWQFSTSSMDSALMYFLKINRDKTSKFKFWVRMVEI